MVDTPLHRIRPGLTRFVSPFAATALGFVVLALAASAPGALAQSGGWTALPGAPVAGRHDDIHFVTPQIGWVCSSSGRILKTTNGGTSWTEQIETTEYFRAIYFSDAQHGWAGTLASTESVLWRTTTGGALWEYVPNLPTEPTPPMVAVCGLSGFGSDFIAGTGAYFGFPRFLRSTDAGANWTVKDMSAHARNLIDCHFWSADSGFAVGGSPAPDADHGYTVILFTADGGTTWETRHTGTVQGSYGWKIFFQSPQNGWVSTYSLIGAEVYKTTDGGVTWEEQDVPGTDELEGIGFATPTRGWTDGWGNTAQTFDGGDNWQVFDFGNNNINRFFFLPDGTGYASGSTIYKYDPSLSDAPPFPPALDLSDAAPQDPLRLRSYPNPAQGEVRIEFILAQPAPVTVRMYTALGREFRTLVADQEMGAGTQIVTWDGSDADGRSLPSGRYLYRVDAGGVASSRILAIVR